MYIELMHRHYGVQKPIKHMEIHCEFSEVYLGLDNINEEFLLKHIPEGWLPTKPDHILLTVRNEHGSTGQCGLSKFRSWGKYFDAYCLKLLKEPESWWNND